MRKYSRSFNPLRLGVVFALLVGGSVISAQDGWAGFWEASLGFNYNRTEYSAGSYSWNRRQGGSIGYNFNDASTLEFAYQRSYEKNHFEGFEDSTYRDEVYSTNLVWNILGRGNTIQPYLKTGIGQLNRRATIYDNLGRSQIQTLDQVTGVLGVGFRIMMTKTIGLRIEGTSYLAGGKLSTWRDNFGATFGLSLFF